MMETHWLRIYTPDANRVVAFPSRPECVPNVTRECAADGALAYWKLRDDGTEQMCILAPGQWNAIEQLTAAEHEALLADYEKNRKEYWDALKKRREELKQQSYAEAN